VAVALGPSPKFQAFDSNGDPLVGGRLFTFMSGTDTPLSTFTDTAGDTANTNPVILDARGEASIWLTIGQAYRMVLKDSTEGTTFWTMDGVVATPTASPTLIDDYSATVAQMRLTTDPGEVGTENLATSQAGDIERERFVMKEMKGTAQWYETYTTRRMINGGIQTTTLANWGPAGLSAYNFLFQIPDGWQSGSPLLVSFMRRVLTGPLGGTAMMAWEWRRLRHATDVVFGISSSSINFVVANTNVDVVTLTVTPGDGGVTLQAGDVVNVVVTRYGDDAGDTATATLVSEGFWLDYTGIASR
jgi:hypothetical protein